MRCPWLALFLLIAWQNNAYTGAQEDNIIELLKYASKDSFGAQFTAGYHTIILGKQLIQGQREPQKRLKKVGYDFTGKTVLDFGTNIGGMLFCVAKKIKAGIGIDYNYKAINAAQRLKAYYGYRNINFFVFNLERDPLNLIKNLNSNAKIDICFMLSLALWVKNWRSVATFASQIAPSLLFETHGDEVFQAEQITFLRTLYKKIVLVNNSSEDDPLMKNRRLLLCSN